MPAQLAELPAGQWVRARGAVLDPADVQGRGFEVDLLPPKVHDLGRPQAMPIGQKHHQSVAVAVAVVADRLDQFLHFAAGQVLPGPQIGVFRPAQGNCSIYSDWRNQPQLRFGHDKCAPLNADCSYIGSYMNKQREAT